MESTSTGDRIRSVRKRRGMTQRELATAAGLSYSTVKKLEQGDYGGVRMETLHKLALALRVPTSVLAAGPDAEAPERADVEQWAPVRRALEGRPDGAEPDEEPTLDGLQSAFSAAVPLLIANRYEDVRTMLPGLLRDADRLVAQSVNGTHSAARRLRSQTRQVTALLMSHTWQFTTAAEAIEMARDDASDGLTQMAAVDEQCWGLIRAGRLAETRELATRWADDAEPRISKAEPGELAAWGRFLLRVSTAAVRDNRPGEAEDALKLARVAAVACGTDFRPESNPWQVFGPSTVAVIAAENAVIQGRPEVALAIAAHLRPENFPVSRHYYRHRLDVASAHMSLRQYAEAVSVLQDIRAGAPEWLVQQRYARDILAGIVEHRRTLTAEMRELADAVRLPL
jgi:transcriptional regulator with XRE-family HTH domain